jgi:hypothetical protein
MSVRPMDKITEYLLTRGYKFEKRDTNWVDIMDEKRGIGIGVDYYKNETFFNCFVKSGKNKEKNGWELIASTTKGSNVRSKPVEYVDKKVFIDIVSDINSTAADMLKKFNDYDIERTLETLDE